MVENDLMGCSATVTGILSAIAREFCNRCCKYEAENEIKGQSMTVCDTCPVREFFSGEPRADAIRTEDSIFMQLDTIATEACDFYCAFSDDGNCVDRCPMERLR